MADLLKNLQNKWGKKWKYNDPTDGNGYSPDPDKPTIDCTNLVHQSLKGMGYEVEYINTKLLEDKAREELIKESKGKPNKWDFQNYYDNLPEGGEYKPGDVILFKNPNKNNPIGHAAIIVEYNPQTRKGTFFGAQGEGIGTKEFDLSNKDSYWGGKRPFSKVMRVKESILRDGEKGLAQFEGTQAYTDHQEGNPPPEFSDPPPEFSDPPPESSDSPPESSDPPPESSDPPLESSDPPPESSDPPPESSDPPPEFSDPPPESSDPPPESSDPPPESSDPPPESSDPPPESNDPPPESNDPPSESSDPPPETIFQATQKINQYDKIRNQLSENGKDKTPGGLGNKLEQAGEIHEEIGVDNKEFDKEKFSKWIKGITESLDNLKDDVVERMDSLLKSDDIRNLEELLDRIPDTETINQLARTLIKFYKDGLNSAKIIKPGSGGGDNDGGGNKDDQNNENPDKDRIRFTVDCHGERIQFSANKAEAEKNGINDGAIVSASKFNGSLEEGGREYTFDIKGSGEHNGMKLQREAVKKKMPSSRQESQAEQEGSESDQATGNGVGNLGQDLINNHDQKEKNPNNGSGGGSGGNDSSDGGNNSSGGNDSNDGGNNSGGSSGSSKPGSPWVSKGGGPGGANFDNLAPIVLDLDKDGKVELLSPQESKAFYDAEGDGFKENIGWVNGSDGFLVYDEDGNNKIENTNELVIANWGQIGIDQSERYNFQQEKLLEKKLDDTGDSEEGNGGGGGGGIVWAGIRYGRVDSRYSFQQENLPGLVGDSGNRLDFNRDGRVDKNDFDVNQDGVISDLEGLRYFDTNSDGVFDHQDDQWGSFKVWVDKDKDGISDEGELMSLDQIKVNRDEAGNLKTESITSISLDSDGDDYLDNGNKVYGEGKYTMDGEEHLLKDVGLGKSGRSYKLSGDNQEILEVVRENGDRAVVFEGNGAVDFKAKNSFDDVSMMGNDGDDKLEGNKGDDTLIGGKGNDQLKGSYGDDTYVIGRGAGVDVIDDSYDRVVRYFEKVGYVYEDTDGHWYKAGKEGVGKKVDLSPDQFGKEGMLTINFTYYSKKGWVGVNMAGEVFDENLDPLDISKYEYQVEIVGNDLHPVIKLNDGMDWGTVGYKQITWNHYSGSGWIGTDTDGKNYQVNQSTKKLDQYHETPQGDKGFIIASELGLSSNVLASSGYHQSSLVPISSEIVRVDYPTEIENFPVDSYEEIFNAGDDTIYFTDDIDANDLIFEYNGVDLTIGIKDPNGLEQSLADLNNKVVIKGFGDEKRAVENIKFFNGLELDLKKVIARIGVKSGGGEVDFGVYMADQLAKNGYGPEAMEGKDFFWQMGAEEKEITLKGGGDNLVVGNEEGNQITTGGGADTVDGGAGNDDIKAGAGDDLVEGGAGDDRIDLGKGNNKGFGGAGNDVISGGSGDDVMEGNEGNDSLFSRAGDDVLKGGVGDDYLSGGSGRDFLYGGEGDDRINRGAGESKQSEGNVDLVDGGKGDDLISGVGGANRIDYMDGGEGNDELILEGNRSEYTIDVYRSDFIKVTNLNNKSVSILHNMEKISFSEEGEGNEDIHITDFMMAHSSREEELEAIEEDGDYKTIDHRKKTILSQANLTSLAMAMGIIIAPQTVESSDSILSDDYFPAFNQGKNKEEKITLFSDNKKEDLVNSEMDRDTVITDDVMDHQSGGSNLEQKSDPNLSSHPATTKDHSVDLDHGQGGQVEDGVNAETGDQVYNEVPHKNDPVIREASSFQAPLTSDHTGRMIQPDRMASVDPITIENVAGKSDLENGEIGLELILNRNDHKGEAIITIGGLPEGFKFNHGKQLSDGSWLMSDSEITGLKIIPTSDRNTDFTLDIRLNVFGSDEIKYDLAVSYSPVADQVKLESLVSKKKSITMNDDDQVDGTTDNDVLYGGGGKDTLRGGDGNDQLYGDNTLEYTETSIAVSSSTVDKDGSETRGYVIRGVREGDYFEYQSKDDGVVRIGEEKFKEVGLELEGKAISEKMWVLSEMELEGLKLHSVSTKSDYPIEIIAINTDRDEEDSSQFSLSYDSEVIKIENLDNLDDQDDDTIYGGTGADELHGEGGDDQLYGESGEDKLYGGDGEDTLYVDNDDTVIDGGAGYDKVMMEGNELLWNKVTGVEQVEGSSGDDIVSAFTSEQGVLLKGNDGDDDLIGGRYNDTLKGGSGTDRLEGGGGDDTIHFDSVDASVMGGAGYDKAYVEGAAGVKLNLSQSSIEEVVGGVGDDRFVVDDTDDLAKKIDGGAGDDEIDSGRSADVLNGGAGSDTLNYTRSTGGVKVNLESSQVSGGLAEGDTISGFENIKGSGYSDVLTGSDEANELSGGRGDDIIDGKAGDDTIKKGEGNDLLKGGEGNDVLDYENDFIEEYFYHYGGSDAKNLEVRGMIDGVKKVILKDGFDSDTTTGIEEIHFSDDKVLYLNGINNDPLLKERVVRLETDSAGRGLVEDMGDGRAKGQVGGEYRFSKTHILNALGAKDFDHDELVISLTGNGDNGIARLDDDDVYFKLNRNFNTHHQRNSDFFASWNNGDAGFDVSVRDGRGGGVTGRINLDIEPVNDTPWIDTVEGWSGKNSNYPSKPRIEELEDYTYRTYEINDVDSSYRQIGLDYTGHGDRTLWVESLGDGKEWLRGIYVHNPPSASDFSRLENMRYSMKVFNLGDEAASNSIETRLDFTFHAPDPDGSPPIGWSNENADGEPNDDGYGWDFAHHIRYYTSNNHYWNDYSTVQTVMPGSGSGNMEENISFDRYNKALVFDLNGDGIDYYHLNDRKFYDFDRDGVDEKTAWVKGDNALLLYDQDGDGNAEVFTSEDDETSALGRLKMDFSGEDGFFNEGDTDWSKFFLWQDLNGNGIQDTGEVKSLTDSGISEINFDTTTSGTGADENVYSSRKVNIVKHVSETGENKVIELEEVALENRAVASLNAVVLSLDGEIEYKNIGEGIYYDSDEDSESEKLAWVEAENYMVIDHTGKILSHSDLNSFDTNQSGVLETDELSSLFLYNDKNQDGVVDQSSDTTNEKVTFSSLNITSLSTALDDTGVETSGDVELKGQLEYQITDPDDGTTETQRASVVELAGEEIATGSTPPIVLDRDGDGLEFSSLSKGVYYDIDGDGTKELTAWVGSDDAILAYDYDQDGRITDGKEISFVGYHKDAITDLEGLKLAFDSNEDGVFNSLDQKWNHFYLWNDKNLDGVSATDELEKLSVSDVSSINLETETGSDYREDDVKVLGTTIYETNDGRVLKVGDTEFNYLEKREEQVGAQSLETEKVERAETLEEAIANLNRQEGRESTELLHQSAKEEENLTRFHQEIEECYAVEERKLEMIRKSDEQIRKMSEELKTENEVAENLSDEQGVVMELSELDLELRGQASKMIEEIAYERGREMTEEDERNSFERHSFFKEDMDHVEEFVHDSYFL